MSSQTWNPSSLGQPRGFAKPWHGVLHFTTFNGASPFKPHGFTVLSRHGLSNHPLPPKQKRDIARISCQHFFLKKKLSLPLSPKHQKKMRGKKKVISWANKGSSLPHATSRASQPHNQTLVTHGYTMVTSRWHGTEPVQPKKWYGFNN